MVISPSPNLEGEGEITMRDLIKNCLRMRPERIIVGEVRGPEVFDLLQAMNTGHDGSMGTIHANTPRECLNRMEAMIAMGGFTLPARTVKEIIVGSVDVIVQAARLRDGSRVNVIAPPLAIDGAALTIRKFKKDKLTLQQLVKYGSISPEGAEVLRILGRVRANVLISGGTGSGKTTLLNCLTAFIEKDERVITCEDSAELQLQQPHVVRLETRPPNLEGEGEITMRDLIKNCLRMRPERIIVGEVRGPESFDLLQAMNTGHDGSMGTLHANSPREALSRLESMITMGGYSLPSRTIREMITSSIDVVVQAARLRDGSRRITHISEVLGMEGDVIVTQDIFVYDIMGEDSNGMLMGRHRSTGITKPQFAERARYFNEEANLVEALEKSNTEQRDLLDS